MNIFLLFLLGIYYLMLVYMYVIIDIGIHTQNSDDADFFFFQQTQFAKMGVGGGVVPFLLFALIIFF